MTEQEFKSLKFGDLVLVGKKKGLVTRVNHTHKTVSWDDDSLHTFLSDRNCEYFTIGPKPELTILDLFQGPHSVAFVLKEIPFDTQFKFGRSIIFLRNHTPASLKSIRPDWIFCDDEDKIQQILMPNTQVRVLK